MEMEGKQISYEARGNDMGYPALGSLRLRRRHLQAASRSRPWSGRGTLLLQSSRLNLLHFKVRARPPANVSWAKSPGFYTVPAGPKLR